MPYREKPIEKLYYSIGEVARMFEVKTSLIRFWEKEFDVIKPKKNAKGNRLFTKQDIESFQLIFHLVKDRGYTLDGAKKQLKQKRSETESQAEMLRRLNHIKSFLEHLRGNL